MDVEDNTMQIYGPAREGPSTSYGQRERAVQSFAVQPNLDLGGRRAGCLSQPANDCTALSALPIAS